MFPFWVIPVVLGVATGSLVEKNYCDNEEARAQQQAKSDGKRFVPTGDKLCDLIERDRYRIAP